MPGAQPEVPPESAPRKTRDHARSIAEAKATGPLFTPSLQGPRLVVALAAASVLLISAVQAYPQRQAPSNPVPAPAAPQAIPASEVAERSEDLKRLLRRVETQLAGSPTVQDFDQQLNRRGRELRRSALETDGLLSQAPELLDLREQERYWSTEVGSSAGFQEQLTGRAAAMEKEVRALDGLQAVWEATRAEVKARSELEPLAARIDTALAAIQAAKSHTQSRARSAHRAPDSGSGTGVAGLRNAR